VIVELTRLPLVEEADVFTLRHRGREVAAALGLDDQDQIRVATALSEVGREALDPHGDGFAMFCVDFTTDATLTVTITTAALMADDPGSASVGGLTAARRLMDSLEVIVEGTSSVVRMGKRLPLASSVRQRDVAAIRSQLATIVPVSPLDVLRTQNGELVTALDQLRERQADLVRLNAELEETNAGVMALYGQLSDELEETNRGVVALYAELDEKTLQLQRASEAKSRFLASISHELRTPVNSVIALKRLLLEPGGDPLTDDQRQQIELIGGSASGLLRLVNELLDLAKAESGRLDPEPGNVDLGAVFAELRGALRPLVPKGVSFDVQDPISIPAVETDGVLLGHVLRNLLSNALKFTEAGQVSMIARLRESAQHAEITIADTGIGISPEDRDRIFEEFFQVRGPLQTRSRGTGLGLAYVRRVLDALGGTLDLTSEIGKGTAITVRLPLLWSAPMSTSQIPVPAEAPPIPSVGTVLVVDDDAAFREVLRGLLQGLADRVVEASDGVEALAASLASNPEVVFLDLRMPTIDGSHVLEEMGRDPRLRDIPVIIVTSVDLDGTARAHLSRASVLLSKEGVTRARIGVALSQALKDR
jgi:signal transduction histidine kinase/CheY-like chemotaxis protein